MRKYIIQRLLLVFPGAIVLTLLVFGMVRLVPGDALNALVQEVARAGGTPSPEMKARLRAEMGLDRPIYTQYFLWMGDVLRGDLGKSFHSKKPILPEIKRRFPITLELVILELIGLVLLGVTVGVVSAINQDNWLDFFLRGFTIVGLSVPYFWTGVLMLLGGSIWLGWSPPLKYISFGKDPLGNLMQFGIPAVILSLATGSALARMTRAAVLEVLRQDYVRTARAKGLAERTVLVRHALRNALIPVVSLAGILFAFSLGGSVILELIFNLNGIGKMVLIAIQRRDYPVIQAVVLFIGVLVMLVNILIDLSYAWLNPRIRFG